MWEWLETSLQYGTAPVIAAGALLIQQRRTDRRDEIRRREEREERQSDRDESRQTRAIDREHERALADAEHAIRLAEFEATLEREREARTSIRRMELEDAWRPDRQAAYLRMLTFVEQFERHMGETVYTAETDDDDQVLRDDDASIPLDLKRTHEFESLVAEVSLFGSPAAAEAARSVYWFADRASWSIYYTLTTGEPPTFNDAFEKMDKMNDARQEFLDAVRIDLGIQNEADHPAES